jgi:hypothetical protein
MKKVDPHDEIIELTDVVEEEPKEKTAGHGPDQRGDKNLEPLKEASRPLSPKYESEVRAMKETLRLGAEEWMAAEGVRILERVAREMFPKIAREVLRQEIEKLRTEIKEKE